MLEDGDVVALPSSMKWTFVLEFVIMSLLFTLSRQFQIRRSLWHRIVNRAMKQSSVASERKVLVPVANGSEEIETVTIVDTLVRGGAKVTLAAVQSTSLQVVCSRGVNLVADTFIADCVDKSWDMIVCPGGDVGAQALRDCEHVRGLLSRQIADGGLVGAICAAPALVLCENKLVDDKRITCYPAQKYIHKVGVQHASERIVVDGNVITSQGPGTALDFSLKLVEILFGAEVSERIKKEMVVA
jgi:4-methyl-5(b-hydroxyethyl)-thiazole monophosphate biosynthesis